MSIRIPLYLRPVQKRSHKRFEHVINVARHEISDAGIEELTIAELAKRSGVSVHSLYLYFPSIRGVFGYFLEQIHRDLELVIDDFIFASKSQKDWETQVSNFLKYFGLSVSQQPHITKTLLVCRIDPILEQYWWQMVIAVEKQISDWLRAMSYQPRGVPISEMTRFIVVQINGMLMEVARRPDRDPIKSIHEFRKILLQRLRDHID